jgi:Protein of unknown function (DUF1598)
MLRNTSRASGLRSPLVPVSVVAGLFTLVVVAALVLSQRGDGKATSSAKPATSEQPASPQVATNDEQSTPQPRQLVARTQGFPKSPGSSLGASAEEPASVRLGRVTGHLAAGEIGPALGVAFSVSDPQEKTDLLKRIADAQMKAGETQAAVRTLRGIPLAEERQAAGRQHAGRWASAAGGSGADFTQLIDLIRNETSGVWKDDGDPNGGSITEYEPGVRVDPNGLLSFLSRGELDGRLKTLGIRARAADLNEDMARPSNLRLVSLTRLEKEVGRRIAEGKSVVETMKNLAGLYKVEYVFVFPENGEIVIGGPAAGWKYNDKGQPVATDTGKPTLQLDDLVTVLRTFSPKGNRFFSCLIVPRQDGLKLARAIGEASQKRGPLSRGGTRPFVDRITKALGLQDVKVVGVPAESRVARVIVEADYRMKLIGIERLKAGAKIPSYFQLLARNPQQTQPALDALRWWLTMKYDGVVHSKNRNVFQIQGSSVLCQGLNEKITPDGQRIQTGMADPINLMFAANFTANYAELAQRDLVFADLQNVFDLALVAALVRHERLDRKTGWTGGAFARGGRYEPAGYEPVKTVMSVSNYRVYNGKDVVIQVAGGVRADLMAVVKNDRLNKTAPRLGSMLSSARAPKLPDGRWWWDVKADAK